MEDSSNNSRQGALIASSAAATQAGIKNPLNSSGITAFNSSVTVYTGDPGMGYSVESPAMGYFGEQHFPNSPHRLSSSGDVSLYRPPDYPSNLFSRENTDYAHLSQTSSTDEESAPISFVDYMFPSPTNNDNINFSYSVDLRS